MTLDYIRIRGEVIYEELWYTELEIIKLILSHMENVLMCQSRYDYHFSTFAIWYKSNFLCNIILVKFYLLDNIKMLLNNYEAAVSVVRL